ncbi:MAG: M28 family peptidase [Clostridia bacterium]|nr:M28 family peptidase [Clostridia bacterium]
MAERTLHTWREDLLQNYQIRKTDAQKTAFIAHLAEIYGDRMHVEESGKIQKNRNIVIGNPDTASVVYGAHYDTCARLPFPNFITPKNFVIFLLYQIFVGVVMAAPVLLVVIPLTTLFVWLGVPDGVDILLSELCLFAGILGTYLLMTKGPSNRYNANDNTSGVVTVLTLADRLAGRNDVCFVLFDNEEVGLFGSAAFAKEHKNVRDRTLLVNFDCVSDGDWLLILASKPARRTAAYGEFCESARRICASTDKFPLFASSSTTVYPSDQMNFKKYIAVAALKKTRTPLVGYYMDRIHTPKDTVFDERNIDVLTDIFSDIGRFAL